MKKEGSFTGRKRELEDKFFGGMVIVVVDVEEKLIFMYTIRNQDLVVVAITLETLSHCVEDATQSSIRNLKVGS